MSSLSANQMKHYLSKSISSLNRNKVNGLMAEIDFRNYIGSLGFDNRVSVGGWIARSEGPGKFSHRIVAFFPEIVQPEQNYSTERHLIGPPIALHTICSTFHQIGIHSYFCAPLINSEQGSESLSWKCVQLALPTQQPYGLFPEDINGFNRRSHRYNFLRYNTDVSLIPEDAIAEEFSKEHIRVSFQTMYLCEMSDIDGILWGNQYTYPVEIKEKTAAIDRRMGEYFGLDIGPFVKLAFYAAKKGNLHSLYVVREIDNIENRNLVRWWCITFDQMAQFASWVFSEGGRGMQGGRSATVKIPKAEFQELNLAVLV